MRCYAARRTGGKHGPPPPFRKHFVLRLPSEQPGDDGA